MRGERREKKRKRDRKKSETDRQTDRGKHITGLRYIVNANYNNDTAPRLDPIGYTY